MREPKMNFLIDMFVKKREPCYSLVLEGERLVPDEVDQDREATTLKEILGFFPGSVLNDN